MLSTHQRQTILETCVSHGLTLTDARLDRDVLVLVPESLTALPSAERLQELSAALKARGHRWIAIAVEEP